MHPAHLLWETHECRSILKKIQLACGMIVYSCDETEVEEGAFDEWLSLNHQIKCDLPAQKKISSGKESC
jgi:hypothetical protein